MIWKIFLFVFLAVGVLGDIQFTVQQHEQLRDFIKQSCTRNGAETTVEDVENVGKTFVNCVKELFNAEQLKKEIEEAKPNGALDEVFKKYCAKAPQFKTCLHNLTANIAPCLDPSVRDHLPAADNATDQLIDFVCYKDGDRIALFIAESGPECFQEKATAINECFNQLKNSVTSIEEAKKLTVDQQCAKYDELSTCVVKSLEECSTPTPANMAESLLRFIRKGSPCKAKD